jgi:predicted CxxxxCH...CXXCH cytochrome family protein
MRSNTIVVNTTFDATHVRVRVTITSPGNRTVSVVNYVDDVSISYGGRPAFAPPRLTGDSTTYKAACDTCHQFGPRDDSLNFTTFGNPTTGSNTDQYFYSSTGDHIKHGVDDPQDWIPPAPIASDGTDLSFRYPCSVCHGDISGYNTVDHIDGTKYLNSGQIGFSGTGSGTWNGTTCSNVNCHYGSDTPTWGSETTSCTSCHNNGSTGGLDNSAPATGKHAKHIAAAGAYVDKCASCHGTNANTGGHTGHTNGSTNFVGTLSYDDGNKTCTNSCHLAGNNAWDAAGTLTCTDCHQDHATEDYLGDNGGANLPVSGLHDTVPVVSGVQHDNNFTYNGGASTADCSTCHTTTPSTNHVDGVFTNSYSGELEPPVARQRGGHGRPSVRGVPRRLGSRLACGRDASSAR